MPKIMTTGFTLALAVMLSACGSTPLLSNSTPDEMAVVDGPPLTLPPDFDLRPPREKAAERSTEARDRARAVITGSTAVQGQGESSWLVERAGGNADPEIREKLADDERVEEAEDDGWLPSWLGGGRKDEDKE